MVYVNAAITHSDSDTCGFCCVQSEGYNRGEGFQTLGGLVILVHGSFYAVHLHSGPADRQPTTVTLLFSSYDNQAVFLK